MAEQPSLGGAIALQGRNTVAEQLGRMQFQLGLKEADRAAKRGIEEAKRAKEAESKFEIPSGDWHRLVFPEVRKKSFEYLQKLKDLKTEYPNTYTNMVGNLSNQFDLDLRELKTLSKDLSDYDNRTATIDKGNTYFSNEWKKYNEAYENASDLNDFSRRLEEKKFDASKAPDFIIRPNRSISYTPFANQKPLETIIAQVQKVPTIEYKEVPRPGAFGSAVTKKVQRRPATIEEAKEILRTNKDLFQDINEIQTIEDVVDTYLATNPYGVRQYADQNNLNLRMNPDGTTNMEDLALIKQDIMSRVGKMTSPKVSERVAYAPRATNIYVGGKEQEEAFGEPDFDNSVFKSTETGVGAYKGGNFNFTFGKEMSRLAYGPNQMFDSNFKDAGPTRGGTLANVKPDGIMILYTDADGKPVQDTRNVDNIKKAELFVRLASGTGASYYMKESVFRNLDNQISLPANKINVFKKQIERMRIEASKKNINSVKTAFKQPAR